MFTNAKGRPGKMAKVAARKQVRLKMWKEKLGVVTEPMAMDEALAEAARYLATLGDYSSTVPAPVDTVRPPGAGGGVFVGTGHSLCPSHKLSPKEFRLYYKRLRDANAVTVCELIDTISNKVLTCDCDLGPTCHARALHRVARDMKALEDLVGNMGLRESCWWRIGRCIGGV